VRVPTQLQQATQNLRDYLHQEIETVQEKLFGRIERIYAEVLEKFTGIAAQFTERDTRTDQRAGDTKLAVDAAFAAAKEATAKIELGFKEQIKALSDNGATTTAMLTQQISDLKDRVIAMESRSGGGREVRDDGRAQTNTIIGVIGTVALVLAVIIAGVALYHPVPVVLAH